jgi:hypothetical protein
MPLRVEHVAFVLDVKFQRGGGHEGTIILDGDAGVNVLPASRPA